jgi:uncharacterized protein YlxP (DUF503 family)
MGNQNALKRSATSYTRYRLFVVISDVREFVASAGGWICDRIQAGWDVSVAVTEPHDLRPLQILGITAVVTDQGFESLSDRGEVAVIAFAAEAFDRDELLRRQVIKVLDHGASEVTIWGEILPIGLEGRVHRLQHRLSIASRAFKAHAVAAVPFPIAAISATEDLYSSASCCAASVNNLREDA